MQNFKNINDLECVKLINDFFSPKELFINNLPLINQDNKENFIGNLKFTLYSENIEESNEKLHEIGFEFKLVEDFLIRLIYNDRNRKIFEEIFKQFNVEVIEYDTYFEEEINDFVITDIYLYSKEYGEILNKRKDEIDNVLSYSNEGWDSRSGIIIDSINSYSIVLNFVALHRLNDFFKETYETAGFEFIYKDKQEVYLRFNEKNLQNILIYLNKLFERKGIVFSIKQIYNNFINNEDLTIDKIVFQYKIL